MPISAFSSVVLPMPLRPSTTTDSPSFTSRPRSRITSPLPYPTLSLSTVNMRSPFSSIAQIDVDDPLVALDLLHRSLTQQLALMQHRHLVGDGLDEVHIVLDHH